MHEKFFGDYICRVSSFNPLDDGTKGNMVEFGFKVTNNTDNAYISIRALLCYDSDGNTISSKYIEGAKWDRFPPGSMEKLYIRKL